MDEEPERSRIEEIAATLRRRREERGFSLADAQAATRIRTRYLQALEEADVAALPEPVYVRGFLRAYADFLGLDGHALVETFDLWRREGQGPVEGVSQGGSVSAGHPPRVAGGRRGVGAVRPRRPRRAAGRWVLAFGLLLAGLYVVGAWPEGQHAPPVPAGDADTARPVAAPGGPGSARNPGAGSGRPDGTGTQPPGPSTGGRPAGGGSPAEGGAGDAATGSGSQPAGTVTAATPPAALDVRRAAYGRRWEVGLPGPVAAVEVVIRTSGRCWVRAEVDGRPAYEGVLSTGEERTFLGGRSVALRLGNPGVATVTVNGSPLPSLGGEPVDVVVSAAAAAGAEGTAAAPGRP